MFQYYNHEINTTASHAKRVDLPQHEQNFISTPLAHFGWEQHKIPIQYEAKLPSEMVAMVIQWQENKLPTCGPTWLTGSYPGIKSWNDKEVKQYHHHISMA